MANVQVNIQYIPNAQGGENFVHEEYKFRVKNRKAERVYWRCCIKGCPATLNTHQGFITKYSRNHNHVANPHKVAVDKFLVAMKTKVQEETKPVCAIYQEEVSGMYLSLMLCAVDLNDSTLKHTEHVLP
ncbi:hypothetical protein SNE40_019931 [Patella caerulea]|uniref:FLYWCH-type domain-containing protein n=1 Tax=Patella caerulea TaxID=87958 RepID=A0AAN8G1S5_PATCE